MKDTKLYDLVSQNGVYAYALYHLGIKFYEYSEDTLEQVCHKKGMSLEQVIKELESPFKKNPPTSTPPLTSCPIDLIIEYLKYAHLIFVKYKLPYIASLIESFHANNKSEKLIEKDLKILFPLFLEDFISHIHQEEDTLFHYVQILEKARQGKGNLSKLYYMMEHHDLQKYATEHEAHNDEIKGLRTVANNYSINGDTSLHMKVICTELVSFEKTLETHAQVENNILFPKAIQLESQIKQRLNKSIALN